MVDKIFALLHEQPLVSIILGFVLAGFLAFVFRDLIVQIIKKKLNLYNEVEIAKAYQNVLSREGVRLLKEDHDSIIIYELRNLRK